MRAHKHLIVHVCRFLYLEKFLNMLIQHSTCTHICACVCPYVYYCNVAYACRENTDYTFKAAYVFDWPYPDIYACKHTQNTKSIAYMHAQYIYILLHTYIYTYIHLHIHACVCARTYIYNLTYILIHEQPHYWKVYFMRNFTHNA